MESLLATLSVGADGVETKTRWAHVWTRPEPAGHAPTFTLTWQGVEKNHLWGQMSVVVMALWCRGCVVCAWAHRPPVSQVCWMS